MIRFTHFLLIIGLLVPAASSALPSKITVLEVKIDKQNKNLVIIHDIHVEKDVKAEGTTEGEQLNAYLKAWDEVVLKYRHNFVWYFEGGFNSILGDIIPNPLPSIYEETYNEDFMTRPLPLLKSKLTSTAVDVRVLSNCYRPGDDGYIHNWHNVLAYLKAAQQSINEYGSDTAKRHTQAVINLTEKAEVLSPETKRAKLKPLVELHKIHHFDVVALGSILYALANYQQPCILICGANHARHLIELLCANQGATISQRLLWANPSATVSKQVSSPADAAFDRFSFKSVLIPRTFDDVLRDIPIMGKHEARMALINWRIIRKQLSSYVKLAEIETLLAEVAARNPRRHTALRSRL